MTSRLSRIEDTDVVKEYAQQKDKQLSQQFSNKLKNINEEIEAKLLQLNKVNQQLDEKLSKNQEDLQVFN